MPELSIIKPTIKENWYPGEPALLVSACHNRRQIRLFMPRTPEPVNATILGFDLSTAEILVDGFARAEADLRAWIDDASPVYLQLSKGGMNYFLQTVVKEIQPSQNGYLVSLKVRCDWTHSSKRVFPRIVFPQGMGPLVRTSSPWKPHLQARLSDVSQYGCQLSISGNDVRSQLDSTWVDLSIEFNDEYKLDTRARRLQVLFKRKPFCHNVVRLMFTRLDDIQILQLQTFIDTSAAFSINASVA